jgi:type IV secretion system protein VirB11
LAGDTSVLEHYLQPLRPYLDAPGVSEVVVNRPGEIGIERAGGWSWILSDRLGAEALRPLAIAAAAVGAQDVGEAHPICTTVLPTGERCQIVLPPAAQDISLTFRRGGPASMSLDELAAAGLFDGAAHIARDEASDGLSVLHRSGDWTGFLAAAVAARRNILISGATGSGKTTLAKSLVQLIDPKERLITIEDARELIVPHRNAVHLLYAKDGQGQAQVGVKQLLESALRMRPDRILLQELRDEAAFFYLRNVNTGHPGSITTIHANSAALAFEQLALLVKESSAGRDLPRAEIFTLLHRLVDVVVQVRRVNGRFAVSEIWYEPIALKSR